MLGQQKAPRSVLEGSRSAAAPGVMQLWGFSQGFYLAEAHSLHPFSYLGPPKVALQTSAYIFYNKTEVLCVREWWLHSFISFLRNRIRKLVYRIGHLHFCCHISPCTWLCNRRLWHVGKPKTQCLIFNQNKALLCFLLAVAILCFLRVLTSPSRWSHSSCRNHLFCV